MRSKQAKRPGDCLPLPLLLLPVVVVAVLVACVSGRGRVCALGAPKAAHQLGERGGQGGVGPPTSVASQHQWCAQRYASQC